MKTKTVMIEGPTASGKSDISASIAGCINAEVVSTDSRAFYREMKIGTDRPETIHKGVRHHFVSFLDLDQEMNVGQYVKEANDRIDRIHQSGKNVIITGGSPLYVRGLINGISDDIPVSNSRVRERYNSLAAKYGSGFVHRILRKIDEKRADFLHENDLHRVIRSIEVYRLKGKKLSGMVKDEFFDSTSNLLGKDMCRILLMQDRETLYRKIDQRVECMMESGLENEVRMLAMKYGYDNKILNSTIGYQELIQYFKGETDLKSAVDKIKTSSRRLAKRQMTWYRREKYDVYDSTVPSETITKIKNDLITKYFFKIK